MMNDEHPADSGHAATFDKLNLVLTKRIIPCLDVDRGRVVKGTNFLNLRDAGDPVEVARRYEEDGADELVFLDISASHEGRAIMLEVVRRVSEEIFMPFTVGGGIRTLEDATRLIQAGAEKVSINSAAVRTPELITEVARKFGSCATVVNIDPRRVRKPYPPLSPKGRGGRMVGGPHQRRPRAHGAGGGRLGPARRGAGRRRDRPHLHGRRRHQGGLRSRNDAGRRRDGWHSRGRQRRRG